MNGLPPMNRQGKIPASTLMLSLLVLISGVVLFFLNSNSSSKNEILGGPILDLDKTTIDGFLFSQGGGQYRFDKNEKGYWTIRGGLDDFLDQRAVATFLKDLALFQGGQLLAGTEVEDRRYEFNGPEALRLTVFTTDGHQQKFAVGAINPVSGTFYASSPDRPGCFPVTEIVRNRLAALPTSLQLATLLPRFDRQLVQRLEIWYSGQLHTLQRYENRWWLLQPETGPGALGQDAQAYRALYADRVDARDGQTWWLANENVPYQIIYECSEIIINEIPAPRFARARLQEWDLDPAWRKVKMYGAGINPDSTEAASGELEIALGMALEDKRVPVLRRGNVMLTEGEALNRLSGPLSDLLHNTAISFLVAECDSLKASREGREMLSAIRGEAPAVRPGTPRRPTVESWLTQFPPHTLRSDLREASYHGLSRHLISNLDRLEILKVLPASQDQGILKDKERVVFEMYGPGQKVRTLEFGFLDEDLVAEDLVKAPDGMPPVGMWQPETGQLLQVPGHVVVTLRSHYMALKDD